MKTYDIFLTDLETKKKFQFPSLPEKVSLKTETSYASYNILDLGEVRIPNGNAPDQVLWDGVFYGEARKDMPLFVRNWMDPQNACKILKQWKENGTPLKLVVAGTLINLDVTISIFDGDYEGGFDDFFYSISFVEYEDLSVTVTKNTSNSSKTSTKRTTVPSKTYTVKSGDCLWNIAQDAKIYGNGLQWTKIYNANKDIIESTAKKYGYPSSDNGHWIFPGTVLTIP